MPNLPSQLDLPSAPDITTAYGRWIAGFMQGLQRQWASVIYVINSVNQPSYTPGPLTLPSGSGMVMTKRLQLSGIQRLQLGGTARLRIT